MSKLYKVLGSVTKEAVSAASNPSTQAPYKVLGSVSDVVKQSTAKTTQK